MVPNPPTTIGMVMNHRPMTEKTNRLGIPTAHLTATAKIPTEEQTKLATTITATMVLIDHMDHLAKITADILITARIRATGVNPITVPTATGTITTLGRKDRITRPDSKNTVRGGEFS